MKTTFKNVFEMNMDNLSHQFNRVAPLPASGWNDQSDLRLSSSTSL